MEAPLKSSQKIKVVVGGRFHADQMALGLIQLGHRVIVETTLPASRFPRLEVRQVHSHLWPEILYRFAKRLGAEDWGDEKKMKIFGRRMAETSSSPDGVIAWSSFALETFRKRVSRYQILVRDSAHIETQYELLEKEYSQLGLQFPKRQFCIDRELEEYELADKIVVLSEFAKNSFIEKGFPESKLETLHLGVNTTRFLPSKTPIEPRPLKVVCFGTIGVRKGVGYLLEATKNFDPNTLELYLVGPVEPGFKKILKKYPHAQVRKAKKQQDLAEYVRRMHVFCLPTIEDGFGQTLVQAMASGLVPITTEHCGAGELIEPGKNGFLVKAADVDSIYGTLAKLVESPETVNRVQEAAVERARECTWTNYRKDLKRILLPFIDDDEVLQIVS